MICYQAKLIFCFDFGASFFSNVSLTHSVFWPKVQQTPTYICYPNKIILILEYPFPVMLLQPCQVPSVYSQLCYIVLCNFKTEACYPKKSILVLKYLF